MSSNHAALPANAAAAHAERVGQSPSGLRTRRAELVDLGLVEDSGRKEPLATGRLSIVWRAVESDP